MNKLSLLGRQASRVSRFNTAMIAVYPENSTPSETQLSCTLAS